jgi:hypothetical protein
MMRGENGLTFSPCSPNFSRFSESLHPLLLPLHEVLLHPLHEVLLHPLHVVLLHPLHEVLLPLLRQRQTPTILKSGDGIKSNLQVAAKF